MAVSSWRLRFVFAEMFVDQIMEKFVGQRAIGFCLERLLHLAEQRNVGERRLAKHRFARLDVGFRESLAFGRDDGVAFFKAHEAEEHGGIDGRKQSVDFQAQFVGEVMEIDAAALVGTRFRASPPCPRDACAAA